MLLRRVSSNYHRSSFEKTQLLLENFVKSTARRISTFHHTRTGSGPSVIHAAETAEFSSAKAAVSRDLVHLLGSSLSAEGVVYSVHYSDINGLSRLENNILAHEISGYFGKHVNVHFTRFTYHSSQKELAILHIALHHPRQQLPGPRLGHLPRPHPNHFPNSTTCPINSPLSHYRPPLHHRTQNRLLKNPIRRPPSARHHHRRLQHRHNSRANNHRIRYHSRGRGLRVHTPRRSKASPIFHIDRRSLAAAFDAQLPRR